MTNNRKGVTLVEAITVGIIAAIVGGFSWSFLSMYSGEISDGTIAARMQMQGENIIQQIARDVRRGSIVLDSHETTHAAGGYTPSAIAHEIIVWDTVGAGVRDTLAGFRAGTPFFYELDTANDSLAGFFTGDDTVILLDTASRFYLRDNRDGVIVDLILTAQVNNKRFMVPVKGSFRCRN
ncbi:MAG: hypothetical protein GF350_09645 [Chitinivibrionales bacterium]|nr:hypothetical protein [Chitinivibrionales bacterium]